MLHPVFERTYRRLVGRWRDHADAPREPDRVVELAAARAALDDARRETYDARHRYHPEPKLDTSPRPGIAVAEDKYKVLRLQGLFPGG